MPGFYSADKPYSVADVVAQFRTLGQVAPHDSRSDKYKLISTADVMRSLESQGLYVHGATIAKVRSEGKQGYEKHLIRMRKPDSIGKPEAPEVILINSHDGSTPWVMLSGLFRFACANGIVAGSMFEKVRIRHAGKPQLILDNVIEGSYTVVESFQKLEERVDAFKSVQLSGDQIEELATRAHAMRYPDQDKAQCVPLAMATVRRDADSGSDLWSVFNRVQESAIRGGLKSVLRNDKGQTRIRTQRAVTGIDKGLTLNQQLFDLADEFATRRAGLNLTAAMPDTRPQLVAA